MSARRVASRRSTGVPSCRAARRRDGAAQAPRGAAPRAAELRYEECLTRDGFDGPYTILYHRGRPHAQRAVELAHGWAAPPTAAVDGARPLRKRHYRSQELAASPRPPVDARVPLLYNGDVVLGVAQAARRRSDLLLERRRRRSVLRARGRRHAALGRSATSRSPPATTCTCRAAWCTASSSTSGAQYLAVDRSRGRRRAAQAVPQRRRPAAHGRAVLAPRLPDAGVRRPARRGHPHRRGQARRRLPRLRLGGLAARRRRLGRHGLSRGRSPSSTSSRGCRRCTCRRRGTARSRRAARSSAASCRGRSTSAPTRSPAPIRTPRSTATSSSSIAAATSRRARAWGPGSVSHHPAGIPHGPASGRVRGQHRRHVDRRARGHARHLPAAVGDGGGARRRRRGLPRLVPVAGGGAVSAARGGPGAARRRTR